MHTGVISTKSSKHRGDLLLRSRIWISRENKPWYGIKIVTSSYNMIKFVQIYAKLTQIILCRFQNLACVDFSKPWALGSQNKECSLKLTACHSIMINIVLMIHGSDNVICILIYSVDYFPPVSKLSVWVVFISHLNIPQKVPFKGEKSRWYSMLSYIWPCSV